MSGGERAARFVVGIDLGTTNSAVAYAEPAVGSEVRVFPIVQLVAEGETAPRASLPSAVYLAGEHDVPPGALALPWASDRGFVVGELAWRLGARQAGRLVTSAKSWLCHGGVDRTAPILPWGAAEEVARISPVAASTRVLEHVRDAWNAAHPKHPLERQEVVLTVPASFDEVARELTVRAAEEAGLRVRLLEEPQAAVYAWLGSRPGWREDLAGCERILVLDVGGGTTDFSLLEVRRLAGGVALERVAVGEHILLGGDNMDLALAHRVSAGGRGLDAARWQQLTALCREAKERLLAEEAPRSVAISLPGRGRGVVRDALRAELARDDALAAVLEGFFPLVSADALPRRQEGAGLREFGLPFAREPEVTRHLAEFVGRAGGHAQAVLFNGGALKPAAVRGRLLDLLERWWGKRPAALEGGDLELAVARGAATYGLALRGVGPRISGGAARAFYLGLSAAPEPGTGRRRVLCVAPRGMEEGEAFEIDEPVFEVTANAPVRFPIYASSTRQGDRPGDVLEADEAALTELPALATVLRFGRRLEERRIPVTLGAALTETGTLEVSCASRTTHHRWRLRFELRASARARDSAPQPSASQEVAIPPERLEAARDRLLGCFERGEPDPVGLTRALEEVAGTGKDAWPLGFIRELWDALFELEPARERSAAFEARWLNLAGFLLRPGFGEERDPWRVERLWRLFDRGPVAAGAAQVRAEWWTLWKRVAGGLARARQQMLLQVVRPGLLPQARGRRKARPELRRLGPQEVRELWQVAGALERIAAAAKAELADALVPRVARGKASEAEVWALGRLAARSLVYGPVDAVVAPATVGPWVERLLGARWARPAAVALALAQMARRTGDRARDLDDELRERVAARLDAAPDGAGLSRWVREVVEMDVRARALVLAESLPSGIRLAAEAAGAHD